MTEEETEKTVQFIVEQQAQFSADIEKLTKGQSQLADATLANTRLLNLQTNLGSFPGGPIPASKQFPTDVLLTYLLHPGTAIYVGYNSGLSNLALDQSAPNPSVFYKGNPTNRNTQLFFVKLSYLFRF